MQSHLLSITKYNPAFRNEKGFYTKDEWTDFSCVGHVEGGELLTLEEYERVENNYLSVIDTAYAAVNSGILSIDSLEIYEENPEPSAEVLAILKRGNISNSHELRLISQAILRQYFWAELNSVDKIFAITFGYDYYMYVGTDSEEVLSSIEKNLPEGMYIQIRYPLQTIFNPGIYLKRLFYIFNNRFNQICRRINYFDKYKVEFQVCLINDLFMCVNVYSDEPKEEWSYHTYTEDDKVVKEILDLAGYERYEEKFLAVIETAYSFSDIKKLRIKKKPSQFPKDKEEIHVHSEELLSILKRGFICNTHELRLLCKSILRGYFNSNLYFKNSKLSISFNPLYMLFFKTDNEEMLNAVRNSLPEGMEILDENYIDEIVLPTPRKL